MAGFKAQRPKQKVLISFGDADSVGLVSLAGDRHARHKFASTATRDLRQWGVDGLDILYKNDVASKGMKKADLTALIDVRIIVQLYIFLWRPNILCTLY